MIRQKQLIKGTVTNISGLASFMLEGAEFEVDVTLHAKEDVIAAGKGDVYAEDGRVKSIKRNGQDMLPLVEKIVGGPIVFHGNATLPGTGALVMTGKGYSAQGTWTPSAGLQASSFALEVTVTDPEITPYIQHANTQGTSSLVSQESYEEQPNTPTDPTDPPPPPPATVITKQYLFLPGLTYSWRNALLAGKLDDELDTIAEVAAAVGLTGNIGVTVEVHGDVWNRDIRDWKKHFGDQVADFPKFVAACRKRRIPMEIMYYNSNTSGKAYRHSWSQKASEQPANLQFLIDKAKWLKDQGCFGSDTWINGMNEDDTSTSSSVRSGVRKWFQSNTDKSRLLSCAGDYAAYKDNHPGKVAGAKGGPGIWVTTDNGTCINEVFEGSDSVNGTRILLVVAKGKELVDRVTCNGSNLGLYNIGGQPHARLSKDRLLVVAQYFREKCKKEAGGTTPPPPTGLTDDIDLTHTEQVCVRNKLQPAPIPVKYDITSCSISGGKIWWKSNLPRDVYTQMGRCQLYWKEGNTVYGGHFDWFGGANPPKTLGNISGNGNYFTKRIPKGAKVYLVLVHPDGKTSRTKAKLCETSWPG